MKVPSSLLLCLAIALRLYLSEHISAFLIQSRISRSSTKPTFLHRYATEEKVSGVSSPPPQGPTVVAVVARLEYKGPYPILMLRFPEHKDIALSFCLDTGANMNCLDETIVDEWNLPQFTDGPEIVGAAGMGGEFEPTEIFTVGDCQLVGLPQNFTFMHNIVAAALPSPGGIIDGLLSLPFFHSFPAGVEFDWYGTDGDPPTVIFYTGQELSDEARPGLERVPIKELPTGLLTISIMINGTELPAVIDTGSPITLFSPQAAKDAKIKVDKDEDEALTVGGIDGGKAVLRPSCTPITIQAGNVSLGTGNVYVGDIPGIEFLCEDERGPSSPSLVILGLDFLTQTYRMVIRAPGKEVWFEELRDQLPEDAIKKNRDRRDARSLMEH